jgi:hypothetical protein
MERWVVAEDLDEPTLKMSRDILLSESESESESMFASYIESGGLCAGMGEVERLERLGVIYLLVRM